MHVCSQSCPTLCNPMDCSPPGSSVHRILQARILEKVAITSSRGSSWLRDRTHIPWTGRWIPLYHLGIIKWDIKSGALIQQNCYPYKKRKKNLKIKKEEEETPDCPAYLSLCFSFSLSSCMLSHVQLLATLWILTHQAPLSLGFSRQEYWSRLLFPSP